MQVKTAWQTQQAGHTTRTDLHQGVIVVDAGALPPPPAAAAATARETCEVLVLVVCVCVWWWWGGIGRVRKQSSMHM